MGRSDNCAPCDESVGGFVASTWRIVIGFSWIEHAGAPQLLRRRRWHLTPTSPSINTENLIGHKQSLENVDKSIPIGHVLIMKNAFKPKNSLFFLTIRQVWAFFLTQLCGARLDQCAIAPVHHPDYHHWHTVLAIAGSWCEHCPVSTVEDRVLTAPIPVGTNCCIIWVTLGS